jgi:hypothetical protein
LLLVSIKNTLEVYFLKDDHTQEDIIKNCGIISSTTNPSS